MQLCRLIIGCCDRELRDWGVRGRIIKKFLERDASEDTLSPLLTPS